VPIAASCLQAAPGRSQGASKGGPLGLLIWTGALGSLVANATISRRTLVGVTFVMRPF
jgi:hypothetical protein